MNSEDVSVVWDGQGATCVRAQIRHFSMFSLAKRTKRNDSYSTAWQPWNTVQVYNATSSLVHLTLLPVTFTTSEQHRHAVELAFLELAGLTLEREAKRERILLPYGKLPSSEMLLSKGRADFVVPDGDAEAQLIVCTLPDRCAFPSGSSAPPTASETLDPSLPVEAGHDEQPHRSPTSSAVRSASPSAGVPPQQPQQPREVCEEKMIYWDIFRVRRRHRRTMLQNRIAAGPNREIIIRKGEHSIEHYAMMLAHAVPREASPSYYS